MMAIDQRAHPLASGTDDSAVGRVLVVPELLEAILEHLPYLYGQSNRLTIDIIDGIASFSQPQALFAVQAVNRMFHNTISGSLRLQKLMFLASHGKDYAYKDRPKYVPMTPPFRSYQRSPLLWLNDQISWGSFSITERPPCDHFPRPASHFTTDVARLSQIFNQYDRTTSPADWLREEASWRKIRIAHYENVGPIVVDIGVQVSYEPVHKHHGKIDMVYWETKKFGEGNTIGDLCDAAMEIKRRDTKAHGLAMAANASTKRVRV